MTPALRLSLLALPLALAACGEREIRLEGERFALAALDGEGEAAPAPARALSLAPMRANADWTHRGGAADRDMPHAALSSVPQLVAAAPIGAGNGPRSRITADPVVAGGLVFAMDAASIVTALDPSAQPIWRTSLIPLLETASSGAGGGLAAGGGAVYATTGYGELVALSASSGGILWRQDLRASGTAAPAYANGRVYLVSRDGRGWALDARTGRIEWSFDGLPASAGFAGGAGPSVSGDLVVFPFASGEVSATFAGGGLPRWRADIGGRRETRAQATIDDVAADPVIADGRVYLGTLGGRTLALDAATGERVWTADEGAVGPVATTPTSIFAVNDIGQLLRLDADTGAVVWRVTLPQFVQTRPARLRTRIAHYGPVLAGGRLVVASADGVLRGFDPATGALVHQTAIPGGAASHPAVAGGTLWLTSADGQLLAYR
ncbi:MAG: outer membrane protein assembly factor BamB family protein [Paracoccaceae bacterium]